MKPVHVFGWMTAIFLLLPIFANAQGYNTGVGIRLGRSAGLSLAQRVSPRHSVELLAANRFGTDAFTLTAIGRRHLPILLKQTNLFVGAGLHKGWGYEDEGERANPFGITGQVGLELSVKRATVAFDFLPQVHLSGRVVPVSFGSALTLRYVLDKRENDGLKFPWENEEEYKQRQKEKKQRQKARERQKRKDMRLGRQVRKAREREN